MNFHRASLCLCLLLGLGACASSNDVVGVLYDQQMTDKGFIQLDNGNWYEAMIAFTDEEQACVRSKCSDSTQNETTIGSCFKEKCKSPAGNARRAELYGRPVATPAAKPTAAAGDAPAEPATEGK